MIASRASAKSALLRTLLLLSRATPEPELAPDALQVRVLGGPLRGFSLAMPRFERPSFALGTYERHVVALLREFLQPGAVAYDIGAHVGYLTLVLARLAGATGKVYSFEPDPKNHALLTRNVAANGIANVTVRNQAVAEGPDRLRFAAFQYSLVNHLAGENEPADATLFDVEVTSLDHLVFEEKLSAPNVIKIDVEGAEARVLRGASRVLRECRPVVVAEVRKGDIWAEIAALMQACDYDFRISREQQRRLEETGVADVALLPRNA